MEEYAEGYRFKDTVLVGVNCFFDDGGNVSLPVSISDAIAYNRAKDIYLKGVESAASIGRPPMFPSIPQGSFVPDKEVMELVRNKDPTMALWTSQEVASFPHARGVYARKDLVEIVENTDAEIFDSLKYYERKKDGTLVGFGLYESLLEMMSRWHDVVKAYVDPKLRSYIGGQENNEVKDLTFGLYLLGQKKEEGVLRVLLAQEDGTSDERLLDLWLMMAEDVADISIIKKKLGQFRDKLLSQDR